VEHNFAVFVPPIGNVQILSDVIPPIKLINVFYVPGVELQRTRIQHLKKIVFIITMLEGTLDEDNHCR
jgi:hypothetical protein